MRPFIFLVAIMLMIVTLSVQSNTRLSIKLHHVEISEAIYQIAAFLKMNVIISPAVSGTVDLQLQDALSAPALDFLLTTHGLSKWRLGNIWYIAPRDELTRLQQEEIKWQQALQHLAPLHTKTWQLNFAKAEDIASILKDEHTSLLSKRGSVRVDARTNMICLQDIAEVIEMVGHLIKRLDVPVKQILIEARLASVDSDFECELGIQFGVRSDTDDKTPKIAHKTVGKYSIAVAKLADGSLLDVKLAALENAGHAELISSPSLFTANQQPASIEAGEEVPYQEVSESGGTAVVFKKAVLSLKVTPQVLPNNKVLLQLQINQDRPSHKLVQGVPIISTRQIKTNILVKTGQTVVLGGIFESNLEQGEERLPFLSQLPVLGWLFKQRHSRENKRELLIFVTPKVIN